MSSLSPRNTRMSSSLSPIGAVAASMSMSPTNEASAGSVARLRASRIAALESNHFHFNDIDGIRRSSSTARGVERELTPSVGSPVNIKGVYGSGSYDVPEMVVGSGGGAGGLRKNRLPPPSPMSLSASTFGKSRHGHDKSTARHEEEEAREEAEQETRDDSPADDARHEAPDDDGRVRDNDNAMHLTKNASPETFENYHEDDSVDEESDDGMTIIHTKTNAVVAASAKARARAHVDFIRSTTLLTDNRRDEISRGTNEGQLGDDADKEDADDDNKKNNNEDDDDNKNTKEEPATSEDQLNGVLAEPHREGVAEAAAAAVALAAVLSNEEQEQQDDDITAAAAAAVAVAAVLSNEEQEQQDEDITAAAAAAVAVATVLSNEEEEAEQEQDDITAAAAAAVAVAKVLSLDEDQLDGDATAAATVDTTMSGREGQQRVEQLVKNAEKSHSAKSPASTFTKEMKEQQLDADGLALSPSNQQVRASSRLEPRFHSVQTRSKGDRHVNSKRKVRNSGIAKSNQYRPSSRVDISRMDSCDSELSLSFNRKAKDSASSNISSFIASRAFSSGRAASASASKADVPIAEIETIGNEESLDDDMSSESYSTYTSGGTTESNRVYSSHNRRAHSGLQSTSGHHRASRRDHGSNCDAPWSKQTETHTTNTVLAHLVATIQSGIDALETSISNTGLLGRDPNRLSDSELALLEEMGVLSAMSGSGTFADDDDATLQEEDSTVEGDASQGRTRRVAAPPIAAPPITTVGGDKTKLVSPRSKNESNDIAAVNLKKDDGKWEVRKDLIEIKTLRQEVETLQNELKAIQDETIEAKASSTGRSTMATSKGKESNAKPITTGTSASTSPHIQLSEMSIITTVDIEETEVLPDSPEAFKTPETASPKDHGPIEDNTRSAMTTNVIDPDSTEVINTTQTASPDHAPIEDKTRSAMTANDQDIVPNFSNEGMEVLIGDTASADVARRTLRGDKRNDNVANSSSSTPKESSPEVISNGTLEKQEDSTAEGTDSGVDADGVEVLVSDPAPLCDDEELESEASSTHKCEEEKSLDEGLEVPLNEDEWNACAALAVSPASTPGSCSSPLASSPTTSERNQKEEEKQEEEHQEKNEEVEHRIADVETKLRAAQDKQSTLEAKYSISSAATVISSAPRKLNKTLSKLRSRKGETAAASSLVPPQPSFDGSTSTVKTGLRSKVAARTRGTIKNLRKSKKRSAARSRNNSEVLTNECFVIEEDSAFE